MNIIVCFLTNYESLQVLGGNRLHLNEEYSLSEQILK